MNLEEAGILTTFKTNANVAKNGTLTVVGLPFKSGEQVEVTLELLVEHSNVQDRYPLRGKPYRYDRPLDGVVFDEWGIQA